MMVAGMPRCSFRQDLPISGRSTKEGFQALLNLLADYAVRGDRSRKERRDNDKEERERVQQSWENRSRYSPVPISLELDYQWEQNRNQERKYDDRIADRSFPYDYLEVLGCTYPRISEIHFVSFTSFR